MGKNGRTGFPPGINELPLFHVKRPVEKLLTDTLVAQAAQVGIALAPEESERLGRFLDTLLTWNKKVNLTAITDPLQAVEGHLVDSIAAVPDVEGAGTVLDLGAGGGFPSIPLAVIRPQIRFVLVDAVGKKVGFLKAAIAGIGIKNAQAIHARAEGKPADEKIPIADAVICRAFMPLPEYLALAAHYVAPGGRVVAMLGPEAAIPEVLPVGMRLEGERRYQLPRSKAWRRVATFRTAASP